MVALMPPVAGASDATEQAVRFPMGPGPHETGQIWGNVDVLLECGPAAGLYRLHLRPGGAIPLHRHAVMREGELVVVATPGSLLDRFDRPLCVGQAHRWGDAAHAYHNVSTTHWATLLCVDVPAFLPADEILLAVGSLDSGLDSEDNAAYVRLHHAQTQAAAPDTETHAASAADDTSVSAAVLGVLSATSFCQGVPTCDRM
jgi:hypothetical protein